MPFVSGFLHVRSGNRPDHELPEGEGPVDPGYGVGIEQPDQGLPAPPPGVWPPPVPQHPIAIAPPGTPPGTVWPPPNPSHPISGGGGGSMPAPGTPTHPIAGQPGQPSHPIASNVYWMLVYTPGFGWKYVAVDPSLQINVGPAEPAPPTPMPHK